MKSTHLRFLAWSLPILLYSEFVSTRCKAEEPCELTLRAVDIETGNGLPGVSFWWSNSIAEQWGETIGKSDMHGTLRIKLADRGGGYYGIEKMPKGYSIAGKDEVNLKTTPGGQVSHTFQLRKRQFPPVPKADPLSPADRLCIPEPQQVKNHARRFCTVANMPGFAGQKVTFSFYPDAAGRVSEKQLNLAAEIFRGGERVAAAARDELRFYQKAEPGDRGKIDEWNRIVIEIEQPDKADSHFWSLECHLPEESQHQGYRVLFQGLAWWDLTMPDYRQDDFTQD